MRTRKTNIHDANFITLEDLETSNGKTESSIGESREAIDDFIKKRKSPNKNKKMATDLNTLLHSYIVK